MNKLNARQLRTTENPDPQQLRKIKKNPIYIVLDNVLDTYNVGAIFRLADAVAATKIYLCGQTETPPNPRIKKASVNTWKWVDWEYSESAEEAIRKLKKEIPGLQVAVIEQNNKSTMLKNFVPTFPILIVVGNETFGVSIGVLHLADNIIELPMFGINNSLNVMVCLGIVLYRIAEHF